MGYIVHYDIAALFLVAVLILYFRLTKIIPTVQNRLFFAVLSTAFVSNILDIVTIYSLEPSNGVSFFANQWINGLYLASFNALAVLNFALVLSLVKKKNEWKTSHFVLILAPFTIDLFLLLSNPWTGWVFWFDEAGYYHHGNGMSLLYAIAFFYMVLALCGAIAFRKRLTLLQRVAVVVYTLGTILAIVIQMITTVYLVVQFAVAISSVFVFLSLENPEDYNDKTLGIYNKQGYMAYINHYLKGNKEWTALGISVHGLKYISDTMGIDSETELLIQIVDYFKHKFGNDVFHTGTYEFIILTREEEDVLKSKTEEVFAYFQNPFIVNKVELTLSVSMAMIHYPTHVKTPGDILSVLSYSLKEARALDEGKVLYGVNKERLDHSKREKELGQILRHAIRNHGFKVHYQAIYNVKKRKLTSAEALVRLEDETLGFVSPEVFIPIAEKNGMIIEIGEYVFRNVCQFIREHALWEKGIENIHVNLSVVQCMQENMHDRLMEIMDEYELDHSMVSFEVTETAAVASSEMLRHNMNELIASGFNFALDDFGTGYSNTATIIRYPFHMIKLDKSMVWGAMEDVHARVALKHIIAMVKELKIKILAEGIENREQADVLMNMGCDYFQGYFYSKPVPPDVYLLLVDEQLRR